MQKGKFTELIRRSLQVDINPIVVEGYISIAYNAFVKAALSKDLSSSEYFTKQFKNIDVLKDHETDFYYSNIPARILNLKRPGGGVWSIEPVGSHDLTFVPIPDMTYKIISSLTAMKIPSYVPFVTFSDKVNYRVHLFPVQKVNMRLFVEYDQYDDEDDINFPSGVDLQIRNLVMEYLQQKLPEA